jgi:hypothetical protein
VAFIKDFAPDYSSFNVVTTNLLASAPGVFSISMATVADPARHVQYGFLTVGPDVWVTDVAPYGNVQIAPVGPPPVAVIDYPTNNAATPARPASSVLSMYNSSATYTDVAIDTWATSWSGVTSAGIYGITNPPSSVVTSTVKKYLGLSFAGVEFLGANKINAAGYSTLHFDLWTPNANQFGVKLVSFAAGNPEAQVNLTPASGLITTNHWVSIDIPISQFLAINPALDLTDLEQLLWIDNQAGGVTGGNFYIDNVYFWNTNQVKSSIALGNQVSWSASSANSYQPQKSANNTVWSNLGSLLSGNAVTNVFDASPVPFYRVQEISTTAVNGVANGGFETAGANSTGALGWDAAGDGGATQSSLDPFAGAFDLALEGQGTGVGYSSIALQNSVPASPGTVTLSFQAKGALMNGGANPQYGIFWFDAANNLLASPGFANFPTPLTSAYQLESVNLTAPANTDHAQIQFLLAVGSGTGDHWLVRIDNVSLAAPGTPVTNNIAATFKPAAGITWQSAKGLTYTVQSSPSVSPITWSALGANAIGTGTNSVPDPLTSGNKFYRVLEDY